jgi:hypothetical protein
MSVDFDNLLVKETERWLQGCTVGDTCSMPEPTNTQANQFLNATESSDDSDVDSDCDFADQELETVGFEDLEDLGDTFSDSTGNQGSAISPGSQPVTVYQLDYWRQHRLQHQS